MLNEYINYAQQLKLKRARFVVGFSYFSKSKYKLLFSQMLCMRDVQCTSRARNRLHPGITPLGAAEQMKG